MKIMKKLSAVLCVLTVFCMSAVSAGAASVNLLGMTVEYPDDYYAFTVNTSLEDPSWGLAGIFDPETRREDYVERGMIVNIISPDKEVNISVTRKESDSAKEIYNFTDLSDSEQQSVMDTLTAHDNETLVVTYDVETFNGIDYYKVEFSGSLEGQEVHELLYGTILSGYAYTVDMYNNDRAFTEEQRELLESIVASASYDRVVTISDSGILAAFPYASYILLGFAVLIIAVPLIVSKVNTKRERSGKAKLADEMERFRKEHGDNINSLGELRFTNTTECTAEALRAFGRYHVFIKNSVSVVAGILMCIAAVVLVFILETEWWLIAISIGIVGYFVYKLISSPAVVEKAQRAHLTSGDMTTSVYAFYDEGFRVAGVQSANIYPYMQIRAARKNGNYVYLYFALDSAYIISLSDFKMGSGEDFVKFITEKTGGR